MAESTCFREAIAECKCYIDSSTMLFKRTSAFLHDIFSSVDMTPEASDIPFRQLEEVQRELQKSPSVFFIGESTCGKSSIINELLQQSSLPVDENPCTARIVRIKYSKDPYASIFGLDGQEREKLCLRSSRKKLPMDLIVVSDEKREDQNALNAIVEIGLDHELLQSGIELIDSPGKSESDALDKILDEYLEKGTVPLFVYVINGCDNLRPKVRCNVNKYDIATLTYDSNTVGRVIDCSSSYIPTIRYLVAICSRILCQALSPVFQLCSSK